MAYSRFNPKLSTYICSARLLQGAEALYGNIPVERLEYSRRQLAIGHSEQSDGIRLAKFLPIDCSCEARWVICPPSGRSQNLSIYPTTMCINVQQNIIYPMYDTKKHISYINI